jgi:hypothetical protein
MAIFLKSLASRVIFLQSSLHDIFQFLGGFVQMSTQGQQSPAASPIYRIERVIASLVMAWVIILTTYMIFQDHALSQASMYFLKIILSLSGAVMLATLPGFMDINYTVGGFSVRAAGGAAAFVFIYTQSPNLPALKLDPAQAKPAQQQPLPKSDNLSQLTNGFPTLMAFSLVPPGMMFSSAQSRGADARSGGLAAGVTINTSGDSAMVTGGLGGVTLGEAVSSDAHAVLGAVAGYARGAARRLLALLDMAAAALRDGVSRAAATVGDLLGAVKTLGGAPSQTIATITASLSSRADDLVSGLFGPEGAPVGALLNQVGGLTTGLLGGLQNSVDGIVSTTDRTVQALTLGLQGTAHTVLDGTEKLAHGVTDVLDTATGGLTAGLTPAANRIVSGIASTTGRVVDDVTPVVANTTSQVLGGAGDGVGKLTEQLNALSPALVSKIDLDFAVGQTLLQLPEGLEINGSIPLLDKVAGPLDNIADDGKRGLLLSGAGERNLLADKFTDLSRVEALPAGPTCIGGCGGQLRDTVSALGGGQERLLGSLNGSGPASGGGPAAVGAGGGGQTSQGPISSAVGATSSILGGATKLLGRR